MALDADELQNLLIENKIGANRYYKNSSCGTIFRKKGQGMTKTKFHSSCIEFKQYLLCDF
jgi:hypothetical protein